MMNRKTFIVLVHVIVIAQPHNQMSPNLFWSEFPTRSILFCWKHSECWHDASETGTVT